MRKNLGMTKQKDRENMQFIVTGSAECTNSQLAAAAAPPTCID